jgi:beta-galactosidase
VAIRIINWIKRPHSIGFLALVLAASVASAVSPEGGKPRAFTIGEKDFLLDGAPLQIRCGEIHFARVPREYWQHRLRLCRAMGLNAVCAYLFWNFHETRPGEFDWTAERDVAEFCRLAQAEGLWVILRPGPYACAEWEMGGLPWWLLKEKDIALRSRDPRFLAASARWLKEVGRILAPLQVTRGGPILLVQVENEYGFFGDDSEYMGAIRQQLIDAGFDVPLFACNPVHKLKVGVRSDLFQVVNFGRDPAGGFKALREIQSRGPLMCGEFYPGWFDTWGQPHHVGDTQRYLTDLEYMLNANASFSIYMAHGGTTFGLWSGADRPFKPDTSSYDYDAPISEAGWIGEKFYRTRALMSRFLAPGENLPEPPAKMDIMAIGEFAASAWIPLANALPAGVQHEQPPTFESLDVFQGIVNYQTEVPAGPACELEAARVGDFAWVFLDGSLVGVMDRRRQSFRVDLPARTKSARLDLLVYSMGRINFGPEVHDRKGLHPPVRLIGADGRAQTLRKWSVSPMELSGTPPQLAWQTAALGDQRPGPAFWRANFSAEKAADTFLDLTSWGKGVVWINGRCLGRFWNIGPTQTMYVPGPWIRAGENEVIVLDLLGPEKPVLAGRTEPLLDQLRPELDFFRPNGFGTFNLAAVRYLHQGTFAQGSAAQDFAFDHAVEARQVCLESLDAHDGKPFAAVAELDVLDENGKAIPHTTWTIAYVNSEETQKEDGSALNAVNGQTADHWHTAWSQKQPSHPHRLVIDLGKTEKIKGFRYTPRAGENDVTGRIKSFRFYVGDELGKPSSR